MAYLNTQICGLFFVFSLVPDLLFDCLRVLEYAEIDCFAVFGGLLAV